MTAIELYPGLRHAHMGLAAVSVGLFAARVAGVLGGAAWPLAPAWRRASVLVDTALFGAGVTLWWLLSLQPVRDAWLGVKLLLVVLYIVLGSLALKRAPTRRGKALAFAASLACIAAVVAIARAHDARAPLRLLW
jgi:uncharacterized membrane protein SirB2